MNVLRSAVVLLEPAPDPKNELKFPVVFDIPAFFPKNALSCPVVILLNAFNPKPVLKVEGCIWPERILFTLKTNGCASVVPKKFVVGFVPGFPLRNQPRGPTEAELKVPSPRKTSAVLPVNFMPYTTPFASCLNKPLPLTPTNVSSRKPPATCSLLSCLLVPIPTFCE